MAGVTGLEPAASGVTGRRSNQLSYTPDRGRFGPRLGVGVSDRASCKPRHLRVSTPIAASGDIVTCPEFRGIPDIRRGPPAMVGGDGLEPPTYWM